jgi:4-diphosphocytidyl-2-C-methyl-D-erythritol kinase
MRESIEVVRGVLDGGDFQYQGKVFQASVPPLKPDAHTPRGVPPIYVAATGPVKVRVRAKINLHLGVGGLREDGFHDVATVYHAIAVFDEITARPADSLALTMDGEGAGALALDDTNLVIRAVKTFAAVTGRAPHARLHLRKQIPLAAGLAGGSADAAATLVACDVLWGTGMDRADLLELAAELGSDVAFSLTGGTALGTGRGERLTPVLAAGRWHWVLAVAGEGLSTPHVYRGLDRLRSTAELPAAGAPDRLINALSKMAPNA